MADGDSAPFRQPMYTGPGSTPVPDPTELTRQAVSAAVEMLRREMAAGNQEIQTRLDGMARSLDLIRSNADALPSRMDEKVDHLQALGEATYNERFMSVDLRLEAVQRQFESIQKQNEQTSQAAKEAVSTAFLASKEAVAAALQAAKELSNAQNLAFAQANEKTERNVNQLLERLAAQVDNNTKGLSDKLDVTTKGIDEKIAALDSRMTRAEGASVGVATTQETRRVEGSATASIIFAVIGAVGMVVGIAIAVLK